jgi:hypothetical protein
MAQKVQFHTIQGFDLTSDASFCGGGDCNFRSLSVPDIAIGNQAFSVWNFTNLLFTLSKGPVSIHANLEVEAAMDERNADVNHLNLERAQLTWKTGVVGDLVVGFDVHLFDPEGGLIYQDEDPGIWLIGSQGPISWNLGYHKRLQKNRGNQLGIGGLVPTPPSPPGQPFTTTSNPQDNDANIFEARLGFNLPLGGGNLMNISPMFLYYARHVPQSGTADGGVGNLVACPTLNCANPQNNSFNPDLGAVGKNQANPAVTPGTPDDSKADIYFPGLVLTGKFGPLGFTAEGAGQLGTIDNLNPATFGFSSMDFASWAVFGELTLDLTDKGIGITPFVNVDYRSGDSNPYDDTLGGYVAISDLTSALRKDGFKFQSLTSMGTPLLGAGGEAAWGFNTSGRGTGPTIGTIIDDITLSSGVFFNNRFGKADNPGLLKITGGFLGKITPQVDMKAAVSYLRFDTTASIQAEAAANQLSRGPAPAACAALPLLGPAGSAGGAARGPRAQCTANNINVSNDMGVEINFNIGWSPVPAFRIQPFASVFIPMDGAKDISNAFLGTSDTRTGYLAGVEFRAQF